MLWKDLKKLIEDRGVKDDDRVQWIEVGDADEKFRIRDDGDGWIIVGDVATT